MPYVPKAWLDYPSTATPLEALAIKALETRAANYAGQEYLGSGTGGYEDFRAKQRIAGANMSVDVGLAAVMNVAYLPTDTAWLGVQRFEYAGAQMNVAIPVSDPTLPRVDRVCLRQAFTSPGAYLTFEDSVVPVPVVLAGAPTASATADNLLGAQSIPAGFINIADVEVAAGAASILTANIRDRRGAPLDNIGSAIFTGRDEVTLSPIPSVVVGAQTLTPTTHDNMQGAYLAKLSRRIIAPTRIRFRYAQGATPATSNIALAICDASGRVLVGTGIVALAGGANALTEFAGVISVATIEAGYVWVWMGVAPLTAASAVSFYGAQGNISVVAPGPTTRNVKAHNATGSTTFPGTNTIRAYTDVASQAAAANNLPVPVVSLSVG